MIGEPNDPAIYVDRKGQEWRALLTEKTMDGNANLVYFKENGKPRNDVELSQDSIRMAYNIPNKKDAIGDVSYYEHRPEADWVNKIL